MTDREEAIMTLKELKATVSDDEYTIFKTITDEGYIECFDMAISALERDERFIKIIESVVEDFNKPKGTYQCFHCGSYSVVWGADFDFSDYGYDGEGIVHSCRCANCGADIEYRVPIGDEDD